jgi:hypothetical protein
LRVGRTERGCAPTPLQFAGLAMVLETGEVREGRQRMTAIDGAAVWADWNHCTYE